MKNFNEQPNKIENEEEKDLDNPSRRNFLKILTGAAVVASGVGVIAGKEAVDSMREAEAKIERKNESREYLDSGVLVRKFHKPKTYLNPVDNINPMNTVDPFFDLKKYRHATSSSEEFIIEVKTTTGLIKFEVKEDEFRKLKIDDKIELRKKTDYETISDKQGNLISNKIIKDKVISFKKIEN